MNARVGCGLGAAIDTFPGRTPLLSRFSSSDGRVAEWFKAPVLKTGVPARVPWVRIPPLPPVKAKKPTISIFGDFD